MTLSFKETLTEYNVIFELVEGFFQDHQKTIIWFSIPNQFLGGLTPNEMIHTGRFYKLLDFVHTSIEENYGENL